MNDFKCNESWTILFKVLDKEGLDIRIPDQNFSISDVVKLIGFFFCHFSKKLIFRQ